MRETHSSARAPMAARTRVRDLEGSRIRELADAANARQDLIALWFGEPEEPTPAFIRDAAAQALARGYTAYAPNLGLPALREALADYVTHLHHHPVGPERIAVTASGVNALMLSAQCLLEAGDTVVMTTPHWPNLREIPHIVGARTLALPLQLHEQRWQLDLDRFIDALTPDVRVALVNSPANPTGWVLDREGQRAVLEHCRRHGIWLVADEVYERIYFEGASAPSFLDIAEPEDRLLVINSFSKAWSMTGWRLGWIVAPPELLEDLAKLTEYNVSCATTFVQHAGIVAVRDGEPFVRESVQRYAQARDLVYDRLNALPGVTAPRPHGGFYAFFRVRDETDSMALAKRLLAQTGVGLAPGAAFGASGEGSLRLCFAASEQRLATALDRLADAL